MKSKSLLLFVLMAWGPICSGAVYNLKIVSDASPDYSDMKSMIRSITANWNTPEEKCWAMFYWNHIGRRQTSPMMLHGMALTDPIRQFNDYGYTMCSTISGINCAIWDAMGLKGEILGHQQSHRGRGPIWRRLAHVRQQPFGALHVV